eukprot:6985609-Alexandrium_andersonii.AAC.1
MPPSAQAASRFLLRANAMPSSAHAASRFLLRPRGSVSICQLPSSASARRPQSNPLGSTFGAVVCLGLLGVLGDRVPLKAEQAVG